jgi:site-specific DNA-methyltransferase (adenine-specific)
MTQIKSQVIPGLESLLVPISELNLDPDNVRLHPEKNLEAIKSSLSELGQHVPLVVQRDGMRVRVGNGRLEAAIALGWTHIAAVVVDEDDVSATARAIADNRAGELAEWDTPALAAALASLGDSGADYDVGFSSEDLAGILVQLESDLEDPVLPEEPQEEGEGETQREVRNPEFPADGSGSLLLLAGDASLRLSGIQDGSVNLVVTSPPYAYQRKGTYGGTPADEYCDWFIPIAKQLKRVLADDGSLVINIKESVVDGQRHLYVLELIQRMVSQVGFLWVDEYIWHKKNCMPGGWPNRLRDSWERLLHFSKRPEFVFRKDDVRIPAAAATVARKERLTGKDHQRHESAAGSGLGRSQSSTVKDEMVLPSNVLHLAVECSNVGHSAAFPDSIPEFFIRLLSDEDGTVLDPFMGSGTTFRAGHRLHRHVIGCEKEREYVDLMVERIPGLEVDLGAD